MFDLNSRVDRDPTGHPVRVIPGSLQKAIYCRPSGHTEKCPLLWQVFVFYHTGALQLMIIERIVSHPFFVPETAVKDGIVSHFLEGSRIVVIKSALRAFVGVIEVL